MSRALVALVLGIMSARATAAAQVTGRIEITGALVGSRSVDLLATAERDGIAAGLRAGASLARGGIEVRYAEARLDTDGVDERNFVDVAFVAAVHPLPFLTVLAGPRAHALRNSTGTRRWLFWTGAVRLESPRFARRHVAVFGEVWLGAGSVNETDGAELARGMETGVLAWLPGAPLFVRIAYRLDDGRSDAAGLRSTVEHTTIGVGYAF